MSNKLKPSILIGLDTYGNELAVGIYNNICADHEVENIISCLSLEPNGDLVNHSGDGSVNFPGLVSNIEDKAFLKNYNILQEDNKNIEKILISQIEKIMSRTVSLELVDHGYEVEDKIQINVFSTLFDPIGSSAIMVILGVIQNIVSGRLRGLNIETNLYCFFPDAFEMFKNNEFAYKRSCVCLQEIDHVLDNPGLHLVSQRNRNLCNFIYLFTSKNENNISICTYKDYTILISEVLNLVFRRQIGSDSSYAIALVNKVEGKTTRYSSIGYSKIIYPARDINKLVKHFYISANIKKRENSSDYDLDNQLIIGEVKEFISNSNISHIKEEMEKDIDGNSIWKDFKFNGKILDNINVVEFCKQINDQYLNFEKTELQKKKREVDNKGKYLFNKYLNDIDSKANNILDSEKLGLNYCISFFEKCIECNSNDNISLNENMYSIIKNIINNIFNEFEIIKESNDDNINERDDYIKYSKDLVNDYSVLKKNENIIENNEALNLNVNDIVNEISIVEKCFSEAKLRLESLYLKRKKYLRINLIFYPTICMIFTLLIEYLASKVINFNLLPIIFKTLTIIFPISLIIYIFTALWKMKKTILDNIIKEKNNCNISKINKINNLLSIQNLYNEHLYNIFSYYLKIRMIKYLADTVEAVDKKKENIKEFKKIINNEVEQNIAAYQNFKFNEDIYNRSIVKVDDIKQKIENIAIKKCEYNAFSIKKLSEYYNNYLNYSNIQILIDDLGHLASDLFSEITNKTIGQYLNEISIEKNISKVEQIDSFIKFASPSILLDVEKVADKSQPIVYLGINLEEYNYLHNDIKATNYKTFYIDSNHEIIVVILKIGFPAYNIALAKYGENLLKEDIKINYQINKDWNIESLIPSLYADEDDYFLIKKTICISKALNIFDRNEENIIKFGNLRAKTDNEMEKILGEQKNLEIRKKIENELELNLKKEGAAKVIAKYIENNELSNSEKDTLQHVIDEINQID